MTTIAPIRYDYANLRTTRSGYGWNHQKLRGGYYGGRPTARRATKPGSNTMKPTTSRAAHTRALYRRNAWKTLARQVVRDEPLCWLRLPGCTIRSTTADHVIPVSQRPDLLLVRANCRGACRSCNTARHSLPVSQLPTLRAHQQRPPALALFDGSK